MHTPGGTAAPIGVSDVFAERLQDMQLVVGEGPGFTAFATGRPVLVPDLTPEADQWPVFVREAALLGACAIFSFPLQVGGIRIGVLELARRESGPLPPKTSTSVVLLASLISYTLVEDLVGDDGMEVPSFTTRYRDVNVATGMIAGQLGIPIDEAFVRLRAAAFAAEQPLVDIARDVLNRHLDVDGAAE